MMPSAKTLAVLLLKTVALFVVPVACLMPTPQHNALLDRTVLNWVSIAQHLQSNDLYNATWANACHVSSSHHTNQQQQRPPGQRLVASEDVLDKAKVLSLYPIHAIYTTHHQVNNKETNTDTHSVGGSFLNLSPLNPGWYRDSGVSDDTCLSIQASPFSSSRDAIAAATPGWMGHLATRRPQQRISKRQRKDKSEAANCIVVPLLGAAPLCALVSLRRLKQGEVLIAAGEEEAEEDHNDTHHAYLVNTMSIEVLKQYTAEIAELRSFTTMAHPAAPPEIIKAQNPKKMAFHSINRNYPDLVTLHEDPDVLQVDNFLTPHECERLIALALPQLQPCLVKNELTGAVEQDPTRTSTNANIAQSSIPSVVAKVCALLQCPNADYLEIFQVLHYAQLEKFTPHTDGFEGPITACGFEQSGRLVTLFVYLNTCGSGGETRFTQLKDASNENKNLEIAPRQGTAVVHFPNSVDLQEDTRTEHEGRPVLNESGEDVDDDEKKAEKWILVTWKWKHPRSDPRYHEALL
jgi:hypothetical protein